MACLGPRIIFFSTPEGAPKKIIRCPRQATHPPPFRGTSMCQPNTSFQTNGESGAPLKGVSISGRPTGEGESRSPPPPGEEFEKDKAERPRPSYLKKHVQKRRESNPPQRGFSSDAVNTRWGEGRSPPPMENLKQSNERNFYPASSWTIWRQTNGETGAPPEEVSISGRPTAWRA